MKHQWKKRLGALLLTAAMLSNSGMVFADALGNATTTKSNIKDQILFSTSFEDGENDNLLESTQDGDKLSGVTNTDYLSQGKGLPVRFETVKGSTDYVGSECKYNLFDGKTSSKYLSSGSNIYVSFQLDEAAVVRSYDIASANDEPGRDPSAWTLYGSDDGVNWVALDARTGVNFTSRQQTKKFGVDNDTAYDWYKLEITANKGAGLTQLSDFLLYTEEYEDKGEGIDNPNAIKVKPESIQGMEELGYNASQNKAALFDGSLDTKFISATPTGFVSVQLTKAVVLTEYKIGSGNDWPERDPKSWVLYGSTDGENWVKLDEQNDFNMSVRNKLYTFSFENTVAYDYYKLDITKNGGKDGTNRDIIQFSEWQFVIPEEETAPAATFSARAMVEKQMEVNTSTIQSDAGIEGDQGIGKLFDGNLGSKACIVNVTSLWVSVQLTQPAAVNMYKIASANDHDPRDPKDWVLYGSTDGENWVKLDEVTDADLPERNTLYTYSFENETEYGYYKLEVLSNCGKDVVGLDVVQFSEWQLFVVGDNTSDNNGTEEPDEDIVDIKPVTVDKSTVATNHDKLSDAQKIFDMDLGTKMCAFDTRPMIITWALDKAEVLVKYVIVSGEDAPTRDPKDWALYGSTDGENWVKLDEVSDNAFAERSTPYIFAIENETAYQYYKWEITANNGVDPWGNDILQLQELQLFVLGKEEVVEGGEQKLEINLDNVQGSIDVAGGEGLGKLFDGSVASKVCKVGVTSLWVSVQLTTPMALTSYKIGSASDQEKRDPKDWVLYGSADGINWVKLDEQTDADLPERETLYTFTVENTVAYTYYKLDVLSNNETDDFGLDIVAFSEWQLFGIEGEAPEVPEAPEEPEEPDTPDTPDTPDEPATESTKQVKVDASKVQTNHGTLADILKIFDGDIGTKMCAFDTRPMIITWALDNAEVLVKYIIVSGEDAPARDPRNWALYGSTDGENWVKLDEVTDNAFGERSTAYTFEIENETAYQYYKWEITANNGLDHVGFDILQLQELQLFVLGEEEEDNSPEKQVEIDLGNVQGSIEIEGGEGLGKLFDGSVSTKVCKVGVTSLWVSVQLTTPMAVNMYKIGSASDQEKRDPKDWVLYGSHDGENWVKLDEQTDADLPERSTLYTFTIDNTVAYTYYKLDVLSNNETDDFGLDIVTFSEWQLFVVEGGSTEEPEPDEPDTPDEPVVTGPVVNKDSVQSSVELSGGEGVLQIFDGETSTKLCQKGKSLWISFALTEAMVINGYTIVSANDHLTRSPKTWVFYGSTDGENWVKLDEQSGVDFTDYFEALTFAFDNTTAYQYYKLDITANGGNDYTQFSELSLLTDAKKPVEEEKKDGMVTRPVFGPIGTDCNYPGAWTGISCLGVYGKQTQTKNTFARNVIFENLNIPVTKNTKLSYVIFPGLFDVNAYDYEYTSCRVIIDLRFSDGTYLSELGAIDQYGSEMTPAGQVAGECLYTLQWNYIESYIGDVAEGKTIEAILVYFDMEEAVDASRFITFFDDLVIEDKAPVVYEHLSDYINILRGTNNDIAFSRGMCTPGVTLPGGFNFLTPVTNAQSATLPYTYQQNGENSPLDSISILHAPNFWIGSYGSFQFMANTSVDTSNGTAGITSAQISSSARQSKFTHQNESAKAHEYTVTLNEGTAASGVTIEVTATVHGAYVRFTFPEGADNANVIFDSLWGSGNLKFGADGKSFTATTNHGTKMCVYGEFDTAYASASVVATKQGIVSFPEGTTTVTMKLATSNLSVDQAKHNLELEIADKNYDAIFAAAQKEWDDLCGIFEIEGATYNELVTFYSCLYRLYAFPSLYSENEGTNENPVWVYASPHNSGKKTSGILYTNNGFWDTYRTAWGAYALFTPSRDTQYLNGMVQHYIETGWVPRWLGPGAVNCMVGTSSDVIFADAYLKGVEFNYEEAWKAMLKSASAYSDNMTAGGRKENNTAPFLGYVANDKIVNGTSEFVGEAYSSSIEGYINDYGLYRMAEAMGLTDEAEYYYNRCLKYALLYNATAGFFMGKSTMGVWSCGKEAFNPAAWNGPKYDFTESVGWNYAFPAVFDGQGLANLYGGSEKLAALLNEMFDDSYEAMKNVVELGSVHHEIAEFKEVKMGQYMHSNQPSHHVIYTYAFSSEQYRVQEYTREVLRHVYVGSELGQGYPGDEDNGEMSGWYIFNALGFYPYSMGSNEYMIGSPLFDKVTIHLENGKDIVIVANNNSNENVYIQSAKLNGKAYDNMFLTHEDLVAGCKIEFEMGSEPSNWGSGKPTSLTAAGEAVTSTTDITKAQGVEIKGGIAGVDKIIDNDSLTYTNIGSGTSVVLAAKDKQAVSMITLTSNKASKAPTGFVLEASDDMQNWTKLDERTDLVWDNDNYIRPFAIPEDNRGEYLYYRVTFEGGSELAEIEFLAGKASGASVEPGPEGPGNNENPGNNEKPGTDDPKPAIDNDGFPVWAIVLIVVALAAAAVVTVMILKKKKSN